MSGYRIVLGSASPRRKELLGALVDGFEVRVADVDETCYLPSPAQYAMYNATKKAMAIPLAREELLVCADTVVSVRNEILGKPHSHKEALAMLQHLNGCVNTVYTGVCLRTLDSLDIFVAASEVRIDMSDQALRRYAASDLPLDKAGAYGIQDEGLVAHLLSGSLSNVIGLPQEDLQRHLARYGQKGDNHV